jgi:GSH-dependent disulfide-bond oxidoreductase
MLRLYTWGTPNGRKISIMIEELRVPYAVHPVDITKNEQFRPEFLALNPNNKIPVLVDPEGPEGEPLVLSESGAILYPAEKCQSPLLPAARTARLMTLQWLMFQMGGIGPMLGQLHRFRRYAENERYGLERYGKEVHRLYDVLNTHLSSGISYLNGDDYIIADISLSLDRQKRAPRRRLAEALACEALVRRRGRETGSSAWHGRAWRSVAKTC